MQLKLQAGLQNAETVAWELLQSCDMFKQSNIFLKTQKFFKSVLLQVHPLKFQSMKKAHLQNNFSRN